MYNKLGFAGEGGAIPSDLCHTQIMHYANCFISGSFTAWRIALLTISLLIAACASPDKVSLSEQAKPIQSPQAKQQDNERDIPKVALQTDLLNSLLTANLSLYQADWTASYTQFYQAAKQSRDPRLAERASVLASRVLRDYAKMVQAAGLWLELEPDSEQGKLTWIAAHVGLGQVDRIMPEVLAYVSDHPEGVIYAAEVLVALLTAQSNVAAVQVIQRLQQAYPDQTPMLLQLAIAAGHFRQQDLADSALQQVLQREPDQQQALLVRYGFIKLRQGDDAAIEFLQQTVSQYPTATRLVNQLAALFYQQQRYQDVVKLTARIGKGEQTSNIWILRGASLMQLEKYSEAERALQRAWQVDSSDQRAIYQLARLYYRQERYQEAIEHYRMLTDSDLSFDAAMEIARAMTQAYPGDEGTRRALRELARIDPADSSQLRRHAILRHQILKADQQPLRALGYLSDALAFYPNDIDLLYSRGLVAAELREIDMAESDFRRVIRQQPRNASALNALGYTLADLTDRYTEAQTLIESALELEPDSYFILDSMGWVLYKQGQLQQASDFLRRAYDLSPEAEIAAHLGEVLFQQGQQEQAQAIWQQAAEQFPDNETLRDTIKRFGNQDL